VRQERSQPVIDTLHAWLNAQLERALRPIALNRKSALFAGSDSGGDHWAYAAPVRAVA
jgi:hypothetical protein